MILGVSGLGFRRRFLEPPLTPRCDGDFLASAQTVSQSAGPGASVPRVRHRPEAADVDHGQLVGRRLHSVAFVMGLHGLSPVDRRTTGRKVGLRT